MPDSNDLMYSINESQLISAFKRINAAAKDFEKGVEGAGERLNQTMTESLKTIGKYTDVAAQKQKKYVESIIAANNAYGRSAIDKEIQRRDQIIKRLGQEKTLVDQVTASYAKKIKVMEEEAKNAGGGGLGTNRLLMGARDLFEGRTAYGEMEIGRFLGTLKGIPLVAGTAAAGLGALAIAGIESYKSLAHLGVEIEGIKARTGLTTKEVSQFSFAAKAVGQDVEIFDRMMRGLTEATQDQTAAGTKARQWLTSFGVDIRGVREGTVSTGQAVQQIALGLSGMTNTLERNKAGMDIFKRAWIEMAPVVMNLTQNLETFKAQGLGVISDPELAKMMEYQRNLSIIEQKWDDIVRHVKEAMAAGLTKLSDKTTTIGGVTLGPGTQGRGFDVSLYNPPPVGAPGSPAASMGINMRAGFERSEADAAVRAYQQSQGLNWRLRSDEQALSQLHAPEVGQTEHPADVRAYQQAQARVDADKAAIKADEERKTYLKELDAEFRKTSEGEGTAYDKILDKEREQIAHLKELKYTKQEYDSYSSQSLIHATNDIDVLNKKLDAQFEKEMRVLNVQGSREQLRTQQRLIPEPQIRGLGGREGLGVSDIASDIESAYNQKRINATQQYAQELGIANRTYRQSDQDENSAARQRDLDIQKAYLELASQIGNAEVDKAHQLIELHQRDRDEQIKFTEEMAKIQEKLVVTEISRREARDIKITEAYGAKRDPISAAAEVAQIQQRAAQETYASEVASLSVLKNKQEQEIQLANAKIKLDEQLYSAREQAETKIFELQLHQLDEIKSKTTALFTTLFENPSKFGSQLSSTLRSAAIAPIAGGLGGLTANALYPAIFGATGQGGIAGAARGAFGGGLPPLINGALPVVIIGSAPTTGAAAAHFGSGIGGSVSPTSSLGTFGSFGGFSPVSYPGAPGGTTGFAGPVGFGGGTVGPSGGGGGGGFGGFGGGRSGGGGGGLNLGGLLGGFKGLKLSNLGGLTRAGTAEGSVPAGAVDDEGNISPGPAGGGGITGVSGASGAALSAGGIMAAQYGLLGAGRGTMGGVLAGGLGGAAVGFSMGGPLGAAIGGAAGFGIGLGEVLAGVETPRNEAKRLAQAQYHISINNNTADSIVKLAQSSYGSNISVAIRSPEVRQMLGLYAAGTGQSKQFPQSADTAHGGGLVESGGRLMQQAQYQYGNAYAYQSSLPTYGGGPVGSLPSPGGGNMNLSLNIDGAGAAGFMTGQVVNAPYIANQLAQVNGFSNGRTDTSMTYQDPGSIVS